MHHSAEISSEMADKIARALNLLGADRDLLNSDADALIDVIDDYYTPTTTPKTLLLLAMQ